MSKTPICDKHKYETDKGAEVVPLHIAIELECKLHAREREVGETNARWLKLNDQLAEARAEIERKDKLVEQMREALKAIDGIGREAGNARREDALRCFAIAAAALAAERGE